MSQDLQDFEDDDQGIFTRCGRKYDDCSISINLFQIEDINSNKEMFTEVGVLATPKYQLHPTMGCSHYVTNYSSDVRPYHAVGLQYGEKSLKVKRNILWINPKFT